MTKPILYDYWRSSASYRVRIALGLKGVDYESREVNLVEGAQSGDDNRARNAQGFVPTLAIDGHELTQSLAIIDYLDATRPEPPLVPPSPPEFAHDTGSAALPSSAHPMVRSKSQMGPYSIGLP